MRRNLKHLARFVGIDFAQILLPKPFHPLRLLFVGECPNSFSWTVSIRDGAERKTDIRD